MVSPISIARSNMILYCARPREVTDFYRDVLGLEEVFANDWFTEFRLTDHSFLSVADASRTSITPARGHGITITLLVDDVVSARATLVERLDDVGALERRWGALGFYVHDPEGHRIEIWAPASGGPGGNDAGL